MPSIWPQRRNPLEGRILRNRRTPEDALPSLGDCVHLINDGEIDFLEISDFSPVLSHIGDAFAVPPTFKNADQYVLVQDPGGGGIGLPFRYDMRFKPDGTRVFMHVGGTSHPAFDDTYQWDVSPAWSLNPADWTNQQSVTLTGADTLNRTISWVNNGTRIVALRRWFSGFRRMDSWPASTPYDITTLGPADGSFTGLIGGEFGMEWSSDYTKVLISRLGGTWNRYIASTPGDLNTLSGPDQTWDSAATDGQNSSSLAFSADEKKMYAIGNSQIISWDLASAFSISPAPSNLSLGPAFNSPTNMSVARGLNIDLGTGALFAEADQAAGGYRLRGWAAP